ncbi:diguanylate cyclase [Chromobacterium sp. IIBBL 290-4]|uniref:GGDEF domain-containing protein n=1 Tax=Chromobacterium sp. IIBBL 290-4 TaxID=2953890 RepID=UPI0020B72FCC|nr:GGDEF domain-containing protein [Chromobacterium sp. IIBBL 290-4]UTH75912.1 GGDEF domain-containing protein [Chromobacterium sp. IIBBL 290-4]
MSNFLLVMVSLAIASIGVITWQHTVRADLLRPRRRWLQASLFLAAGMMLEGGALGESQLATSLGSSMTNGGIALQLTILARLAGIRWPGKLWMAVAAYSFVDKWIPQAFVSACLTTLEIPVLYFIAAWLFQRMERQICHNRFSPTALLFFTGAWLFIWRDGPDLLRMFHGLPHQSHQHELSHALALTVAMAAQVCCAVGFLNIVLQKQNSRLQDAANIDPLTAAGNRRALQYWLRTLEASTQRVCVIMLDIDHFKSINDRYGHPAGDAVIQALAGVLNHGVRENDLLIRYGGEEFCLVMPDTSVETGSLVADRLREQFQQLQVLPGHPELRCSFSAGVFEWQCHVQDFASAQQKADEALYQAKQGGRNQVRRL